MSPHRDKGDEKVKQTISEIEFTEDKRNDFYCSLGFHHEIVVKNDDVLIMRSTCPKCDWYDVSGNPKYLAAQEHKHLRVAHESE